MTNGMVGSFEWNIYKGLPPAPSLNYNKSESYYKACGLLGAILETNVLVSCQGNGQKKNSF